MVRATETRTTTYALKDHSTRLWTRETGHDVRQAIEARLNKMGRGSLLVIDCSGIEVFDFSFASEVFGKLILRLASEYPGRYVAVAGLSDYLRENLDAALENIGVMMIEILSTRRWDVIGKFSPSDSGTLQALPKYNQPIGASELAEKLGINITACNERLSKLLKFALVRRETAGTGRAQYLYSAII